MGGPEIMDLGHPRWGEFVERLGGPEGINFHLASFHWTCDRSAERPKARMILGKIGLDSESISASLRYFDEHGGSCDCQILFNVSEDYDAEEE